MRRLDFLNFGLSPNRRKLRRRLLDAYLEIIRHPDFDRDIYYLIDNYLLLWKGRRHARTFFQSSAIAPLIQLAKENKALLRELAAQSTIHATILELVKEYEIYQDQWMETRKLIKRERGRADSRRAKFFSAVVERDGLMCRDCKDVEDLKLDHIKAVSHGGLSVMENFQLLCFRCNSKKARGERLAIYGWWIVPLDRRHRNLTKPR